MLAFLGTVFFMLITPGPGVLTTAGVGSGFGWGAGIRFLTGLFLGTNLTAVLVISGLTAIVLAEPTISDILVWASIAWFCWMALKIALAGAKVGFIAVDRAPGLVHGIGLQLINPKAYVVNTLLFGGHHFMGGGLDEVLVKFVLINVIWVPVHLIWLGAGVRLRRLELSGPVQRSINIAMALSLVAVVLLSAREML